MNKTELEQYVPEGEGRILDGENIVLFFTSLIRYNSLLSTFPIIRITQILLKGFVFNTLTLNLNFQTRKREIFFPFQSN